MTGISAVHDAMSNRGRRGSDSELHVTDKPTTDKHVRLLPEQRERARPPDTVDTAGPLVTELASP